MTANSYFLLGAFVAVIAFAGALRGEVVVAVAAGLIALILIATGVRAAPPGDS